MAGGRGASRRGAAAAAVALAAAVVATGSDFGLLLASGAGGSGAGAPSAPEVQLAFATLGGVLAIPLYALGYRAAARALEPVAPRASWILAAAGAAGAALGGAIHGMSGVAIRAQLAAGPPPASSTELLVPWADLFLPLWGLVGLLLLAGSAAWSAAAGRLGTGLPRWMAVPSPAVLVVGIAAVGAAVPGLRQSLPAAAPNAAHIVFFALLWRALRAGPAVVEEGSEGPR